eukprot:TRINITY_DN49909_c0_g1_i1.p1 TRINITY_DN49909_c0_g1~~TRINITY_DN49909_c0_g1_i1.p1  ORF type:complete len:477 (+),score=97.61 TRINITY_DN49909_c0_g1_i1:143-1573(+)
MMYSFGFVLGAVLALTCAAEQVSDYAQWQTDAQDDEELFQDADASENFGSSETQPLQFSLLQTSLTLSKHRRTTGPVAASDAADVAAIATAVQAPAKSSVLASAAGSSAPASVTAKPAAPGVKDVNVPLKSSFVTSALAIVDWMTSKKQELQLPAGNHSDDRSGNHSFNSFVSQSLALLASSSGVKRLRSGDVIEWPGACMLGLFSCVTLVFVLLLSGLIAQDKAHDVAKEVSDEWLYDPNVIHSLGGAEPIPIPRKVDKIPIKTAPPPLCQGLILPTSSAQFRISMDSIEKLRKGRNPVQVCGPSGKPLLHAWLPVGQQAPLATVSGTLENFSFAQMGHWLKLTSTEESKHPHASIGPLPLAEGKGWRRPVEVFGPQASRYGSLVQDADKWAVYHRAADGPDKLSLMFRAGNAFAGLTVYAAGGDQVATVMQTGSGTESDPSTLTVSLNPGSDSLLILLCTLAIMLCPPDDFPSK